VAINHVSNALGTINPVSEIVRMVKDRSDAIVVCDGAQATPHLKVNYDALGPDFYAFSSHKMCGPMGSGVLIGRRDLLLSMPPYQTGGDMVEFVYDDRTTWNVLPHKFEAGTPNAADAVGLAAAVEYLESIGMDEVLRHERELIGEAYQRLSQIEDVKIYGPPVSGRSGVISFTLGDVHPHDLATILDGDGVCIRAGNHCTQPLMRRLDVSATARASFYIYNDRSDIDALVNGVLKAKEIFGHAAV
jgi:cysteine desulfurase/selenocysteine lyase